MCFEIANIWVPHQYVLPFLCIFLHFLAEYSNNCHLLPPSIANKQGAREVVVTVVTLSLHYCVLNLSMDHDINKIIKQYASEIMCHSAWHM